MNINTDNLSDGWKKVIEQTKEEEESNTIYHDEITTTRFAELAGISFTKARIQLNKLVKENKASMRRAKIGGHWTKIYRLLQ